MTGTLATNPDGTWTYHRKGPGGQLSIYCEDHDNRLCGALLGRFHFHGTFTSVDLALVQFAGREGDDYPIEVRAALEASTD